MSSQSPIEAAARTQNWLFWIYVVVLVLGAVLTVFLFRAGNKVQEAIKADADARIRASDESIRSVEADANVRIKQIEADAARMKNEADQEIASLNLMAARLAADAEQARNQIGKAQADAEMARKNTAEIQLGLAVQQERAAKAEKDLLALQDKLRDRALTDEQRAQLLASLRSGPKCTLQLSVSINDGEAQRFANLLLAIFKEAGWEAPSGISLNAFGDPPLGLRVSQRDQGRAMPCTETFVIALRGIGIDPDLRYDGNISPNTLSLIIGRKP